MKPRILFRADASPAIGVGHIARITALIEEAESTHYEAVLLFGGDASLVRSWCHDRGLHPQLREWSTTIVLHECEHPRTAAIVIDGRPLAERLVPAIPEHVRTIVLDDMGNARLPMSTVVNHNYNAPSLAASYPQARQRLLGRHYLMLRKDIRRYTRGSCRPLLRNPLRLVITFGGSDPPNATSRTLALLPADRRLDVVVMAGPGFRFHRELEAAAAVARGKGHTIDIRRAPDDPGALFVSADAAICAAGGTLGELAYLGCPALAYAIVDDQVSGARAQATDGLIAGGAVLSAMTDDLLRAELLEFVTDDERRAELRKKALASADSDGAKRVLGEAMS